MTSTEDRRAFLKIAGSVTGGLVLTPSMLPAAPLPRAGAAMPVGVVGLGRQGTKLVAELKKFDAVEVAAICDTKDSRLRRGKRRAPGVATFPTLEAMLDGHKNLQAIFIATPTHVHKDGALKALQAGKHVYCEGPMASTIDDLKAISQAARGAKTVFQVGHVNRSNPVYRLARSFVRSGNIRDVIQLRAHSHQKSTWRIGTSGAEEDRRMNWRLFKDSSMGLPGEMGSHQIDTIAWFLGKYPERVVGSGAIMQHDDGREIPDTVECSFGYEGGLRLAFDATLCNSFESDYELFAGTMGTIKMAQTFGWMFKESDAPTQGWEVYASREKFHNEEGITLIADATKLAKQGKLKEGIGLPQPPLYYAVQDFIKSVLEGQKVACTASDGFRAAAVTLRAHESVMSGEAKAIEADLMKA